jgi:hypothetical protein
MSIDYTPQYPVGGEELSLSLSGAVGTSFGFELTGVPSQSALTTGLLLIDQPVGSTVPVSPLLAATSDLLSSVFTPDVAGQYTFKAYDMRQVVGTPTFVGDPSGETRYELLNTQGGVVKVGSLMELPVITSDGNGGVIELRIVETYIRAAAIVDHTTEIGRTAALQADVVQALTDVVGLTIDAAATDFLPALKELRDKYDGNALALPSPPGIVGHRNRAESVSLGVHFEPDTINRLSGGIPFSLKFAVKLVNEIREKLTGHMEDSIKYAVQTAPGPPPEFTGFWHFTAEQQWNDSVPVVNGILWGNPGADTTTTPVIDPAVDLPTAAVLLCELRWRTYNRHIRLGHGSQSTHPWLDKESTSSPHIRFVAAIPDDEISGPMPAIDKIIVNYLDTIVRMDPNFTPPAQEGSGMTNMAHKYGFIIKS